MSRVRAAAVLLITFLSHVVIAGVATAWWIVRPGGRPTPALVRMSFGDMSPAGAVLYACLISLTPGTTAIDLDLEARHLLLHLLDGRRPMASVADIRRAFERHVLVLFPERRA